MAKIKEADHMGRVPAENQEMQMPDDNPYSADAPRAKQGAI